MERPLVFFHTEIASERGAPFLLELGAVRVVDGEGTDHFHALVCPDVPIDPEGTAHHGIDEDEVRGAPDSAQVLGDFAAWLAGDWLIAHDAPTRANVLGYEAIRHRIELPDTPILDALPLARSVFADLSESTLDGLAASLDIEVEEPQRALHRAVTCLQVVDACAAKLGGWDTLASAALLQRCGPCRNLRDTAPGRPRTGGRRVRVLEDAARGEKEVVLVYGTGDDRPARLPVTPRLLYAQGRHGYLEAVCRSTGLLKTYRLDRLHKVEIPG